MSPEPTVALHLPCHDLDAASAAAEAAGFRLDATGPADEPTWAELSCAGATIVLDTTLDPTTGPQQRTIEPDELQVPPTAQSAAISHQAGGDWKLGRAGMRYRDLIPDRYGGTYIASHIHVPDGGPVPDYVHHHNIVHQLIYCHRGWAKVVYQDQGPPLTMQPGDCILQPPGIRHQVLETSDEFYVVEVGCPAAHRTSLDHELPLPNSDAVTDPERLYGGQRFVHHRAADTPWLTSDDPSVETQDTGLGAASGGLVTVERLRGHPLDIELTNDDDLRLVFVTDGAAELIGPSGTIVQLSEGSSATIPAGQPYRLTGTSDDTVLLDVRSSEPKQT